MNAERNLTLRCLPFIVSLLVHALALAFLGLTGSEGRQPETPVFTIPVRQARIAAASPWEEASVFETHPTPLSSAPFIVDEVALPVYETAEDPEFENESSDTLMIAQEIPPMHVPVNLTVRTSRSSSQSHCDMVARASSPWSPTARMAVPQNELVARSHSSPSESQRDNDSAPASPSSGSDSSTVTASPLNNLNRPPVYPLVARRRGYQGLVVVLARISPEGRCIQATVARSSGYEVLDVAAVSAVKEWLFRPATRSCGPVEGALEIPVRFRLNETREP